MSKTDKAAQTKSRLSPEQEVIYNGARIVVKPLRWGRVSDAVGVIGDFGFFVFNTILPLIGRPDFSIESIKDEITNQLKSGLFEGLNTLLNECVSVPDCPEMTIEDLPVTVIPEIIDIFYDQNVDLKNWRALIQKRPGLVGLFNLN